MEPNHYEEDEISLKELIQTLILNKKMIAIITIIALIASLMVSLYMNEKSKEAHLIISIGFTGIKEGKYPDGTDFDPYSMVAPYVISDAITKLKLEKQVTENQVRSLLEISPIIPKQVNDKMKYALENQGEDYVYFPTEYLIKLKVGRGIDEGQATKILNEIITSYIGYFQKEYGANIPVTNQLLAFSPDDYDYSDISMVLHKQMEDIKAYNDTYAKLDPNFRASSTGMSFSEINEMSMIIDEIDLNRFDSLISTYKLTKSQDRLKVYYQYLIKKLELQRAKLAGETTISKDMLSAIDNSQNDLVAALTGELAKETDQNSYFNSLILKTARVGANASELEQDIAFYKSELADIETGEYRNISGRNEAETEVKSLSKTILTGIIDITSVTNKTAKEFEQVTLSSSVMPLSPAEIYSSTKMSLNLAIGTVLGLMIGVFAAFFKEYWKKA